MLNSKIKARKNATMVSKVSQSPALGLKHFLKEGFEHIDIFSSELRTYSENSTPWSY
jgi:hypothetical protein